MADTVAETKETTVTTPEKKEVEKEVVDISKSSENGVEKPKENGTTEEKEESGEQKDKDSATENGDSTDSVEVSATKRKSCSTDATDGAKTGASPEKKAKLEERADLPANGEAEAVA